jgi:hypothetical protein
MKVLGHDDVTDNDELIVLADLFEDSQKQIATPLCAKQGLATITTASDEMQVSGAVIASEAPGHEERLTGRGEHGGDSRHQYFVMKTGTR